MSETKTKCRKCGESIYESTAEQHRGLCADCNRLPKVDDVIEGIGCAFRLLLAFLFGGLLGGAGYAIGAYFGIFGGLVLGVPLALIGFVYGLFFQEVNLALRVFLAPFLGDA